MAFLKKLGLLFIIGLTLVSLISCEGMPGGDARENPPDPDLRVKKNLEEGRGFRLQNAFKNNKGGDFMFASSNELWRASLDIIDFMPLSSVNYSGGIIITDWYSDGPNINESVKISIRFLTNEVRVDALDIKVFYKRCNEALNCKISQKTGPLVAELKREILNKATIYKKKKKIKTLKSIQAQPVNKIR